MQYALYRKLKAQIYENFNVKVCEVLLNVYIHCTMYIQYNEGIFLEEGEQVSTLCIYVELRLRGGKSGKSNWNNFTEHYILTDIHTVQQHSQIVFYVHIYTYIYIRTEMCTKV